MLQFHGTMTERRRARRVKENPVCKVQVIPPESEISFILQRRIFPWKTSIKTVLVSKVKKKNC